MSNVIAMAMRRSGNSAVSVLPRKEYGLAKDGALQKTMESLKQSKKELEELNGYIKKWCDLPVDRKRSAMAKICYHLIPQKAYSVLPSALVKFMAEEYDVLELIERLWRENVNNVQDATRDTAVCAIETKQMLNELEEDLKTARQENWDAQTLQQYMAGKANLPIYEEVSQLLDEQFNILSPKERERRKKSLLDQMEGNIKAGGKYMEMLRQVCCAELDTFSEGASGYYNYVNFYRKIAVLRDAAKALVDLNQSMYVAKDALKATYQTSLKAIEITLDAISMAEKFSVVGPDMQAMFESGGKRIQDKMRILEGLKANSKKISLPASSTSASLGGPEKAEVIDIQVEVK